MKQSVFYKNLNRLFSRLDRGRPYVLDGFHPDFFLSIYRSVNYPTMLVLPDRVFDSSLKYLSCLLKNEHVVFIPPVSYDKSVPSGFISQSVRQLRRSKELLSSGFRDISFVFCSESGISIPLVGSGGGDFLHISPLVSFNRSVDFLSKNGYRLVEIVLNPGEYCLRGGIIDVYPFSAICPVRVNFLDSAVTIHRFDVQNQLTSQSLGGLTIAPMQKQGLLSLKDAVPLDFLSLFYDPEKTMELDEGVPLGLSEIFNYISFERFMQMGGGGVDNLEVDENLSSVGVVFRSGGVVVPPWFINKRPKAYPLQETPLFKSMNIANINRGDFLVHRDHGVGVFMGLLVNMDGEEGVQEFLSIKYKDGGVVRLDTGHLDLVDYYASADSDGIVLDSLQKKGAWLRKRNLARKHAEETVEFLLNLYVRRNDLISEPFPANDDLEVQFLNDFSHEDTIDQAAAWNEISKEMSNSSPMDHLLCGDVGFGKTEIAMRAAFRCILGGRRVVVLAPTTILANQLYVSFCARLGSYAVNIEMISRFRTAIEIKQIRGGICGNNNDVLIGTHSILNNDIYFINIGLLIIDEEHRFGVVQKEHIKCLKESVDVLSMSATPIPRSLNLAISGVYSISLLQTPPLLRLPIVTRVEYFNDSMILGAVSFEVGRGGQVYFVHNDVQTIESITGWLKKLFSEFSIMFLHGQESPRDIEKKMALFVSNRIQILVCTSIIEAGIDVPNANCIIINNSHLFGVSQLYQMRGRVGRGHRQAYAYLIVPLGLNLSNKAYNRIKTVEEHTRLGSGYNISRADMDLRGSGSLFGYKQSGGSGSVGYEMYLRLIQRALYESGELCADFLVLPEDVTIEVFEQRYIPEDYVSLESLRLSFYKSLASASSEKEIDDIVYSITNRFGPAPPTLNSLIYEYRLRLLAAAAGVLSIRSLGCGTVIKISKNDSPLFLGVFVGFVEGFFNSFDVSFHLLPVSEDDLSVCIHVPHRLDMYSILSQFLDKFKALI